MNEETILQKNIMLELNRTRLVRLVRNRIGLDSHGIFGLGTGSPDLVGVLRSGRAWCLEIKTARGKERASQLAWWRAARLWHVGGGTVRSVEEAIQALEDQLREHDLSPGHCRVGGE